MQHNIATNFLSKQNLHTVVSLITVSTSCFLIVYFYHDKFWWPPDDGAYAYVADLINQGAVLNRDIQDIHMGYINFTNAYSLKLFGDDFISLRYPLMILTVLQSVFICYLFTAANKMSALIAALLMSSLTFVQFINPTANWYALFLITLIIFTLQITTPATKFRIELIGFLLMTIFLYRQPSGVFAGIGTISYLIYEADHSTNINNLSNKLLARVILGVFLALLVIYLFKKTNLYGALVFGSWPILVLALQIKDTRVSNVSTLRFLYRLSIGSIAGILPLIVYHIKHDSLQVWFEDTVLIAFKLTSFDFFNNYSYDFMLSYSINSIVMFENIASVINALFWITILLTPVFYGALLIKRLQQDKNTIEPLGYIPIFFMLVSIHYQIPIYLFYSVALTLVAILWLLQNLKTRIAITANIFLLVICILGLFFHAGQPLARGLAGTLNGERHMERESCGLEHCSIKADPDTVRKYQRLVTLALDHTEADDMILTIPFNPEINYLSKRVSPIRFFNTALGIYSIEELNKVIAILGQNRTKLVFYDARDKYNTKLSNKLVDYIKEHYQFLGNQDGMEVYLLLN